ncbi:hypothetical protein [Deinococcus kurensis]|uniref:hypothetical protein n=1 Tax=Deinococcus kurensis TaxID=2662757 RepID=UPI0012D2FE24|nr:hypothetical protein [Deinococcus kurensis]
MSEVWFLVVSLRRQTSPALHLHFVPADAPTAARLLGLHFDLTEAVASEAALNCVNLHATGAADVVEWVLDSGALGVTRQDGPLRRCPPMNHYADFPARTAAAHFGLCAAIRVALAYCPPDVRATYAPRLALALDAPMPVTRRDLGACGTLSVWATGDGDEHAFCY